MQHAPAVVQTVYGLAALALAVPAAFHWRAPEKEVGEEGALPSYAPAGFSWQAKVQLAAFCFFEARALPSTV